MHYFRAVKMHMIYAMIAKMKFLPKMQKTFSHDISKCAKNWCMTESRISSEVDFWMNSVTLRLIQWFSKSALLREILICITKTDTLLPKCLLFIVAYGNISAFKYLLSKANAFSVLRDNFLCLPKWHVAKIHMTPNKIKIKKIKQVTLCNANKKGMTVEKQHCLISLAGDKLTAACW